MTPVRVFVSHASEDSDIFTAIQQVIRKELPNARVVNAGRNILAGNPIDAGLIKLIDTCQIFIHVISPSAELSAWVAKEVEFARAKKQLQEIHYITVVARSDGSTLERKVDQNTMLLRYDQNPQPALDQLVRAIAQVAPKCLLPEADPNVIAFKRTASVLLLALVATMLLVGANVGIDTPTGVGWLHLLQALIIAYLAADIYVIRNRQTSDLRSKRILTMWLGVWISWMILYLLRFAGFVYPEASLFGTTERGFFDHLAGIPSVIGTVFVYFTYLRLDVREEEHSQYMAWNQYAFPLATTVLLSGFYLLLAFGILRSSFWPDLIKSMWLGVAISLVGGRLNSRLINAPRLPVAFFYMYGLLQMLFPLFQAKNIGLPEVTPLTQYGYRLALLAGKTILADVLAWAVLTRRLEFFLTRMEVLSANVEDEFRRWADPDLKPPASEAIVNRTAGSKV